MQAVDLAVYADAVAGERAALAARAERARRRLAEAAIERKARRALPPGDAERLAALGLLPRRDERALREELAALASDIAAVERLQAWLEGELARRERREPGRWAGKAWFAPDCDEADKEIEKLVYGQLDDG